MKTKFKSSGRQINLSDGRHVWMSSAEDKSGVLIEFKNEEGDTSQLAVSHDAMDAVIALYGARGALENVSEWRVIPQDSASGPDDVVKHFAPDTAKPSEKP